MNLIELKESVEAAIEGAIEYGEAPEEVIVSIQIDINKESVWSANVTAHYDGDSQASGFVIVGDAE